MSGKRRPLGALGRLALAAVVAAGAAATTGAGTRAAPAPSTTELISVRPNGAAATHHSGAASISADGLRIAFVSAARLHPDDVNSQLDVYVRERGTATNKLVSRRYAAQCGPSEDALPCPSGPAYEPQISPDGRYVVFTAKAGDLDVAGSTRNDVVTQSELPKVVLWDALTGSLAVVSRDLTGAVIWCAVGETFDGASMPTIARNAALVAFVTACPVKDAVDDGTPFSTDPYEPRDVYALDPFTEPPAPRLVSRRDPTYDGARGDAADPSLSANGGVVAFTAASDDLLAALNGVTGEPVIEDNGFDDVYAAELDEYGATVYLESVNRDGTDDEGGGRSIQPSLSADGRVVAFTSTKLFAGSDDRQDDVFVRDRSDDTVAGLVLASPEIAGDDEPSVHPALSLDGSYVAFLSLAALVEGDSNDLDVFGHDLRTGAIQQLNLTAAGSAPTAGGALPLMPGGFLPGSPVATNGTGKAVAFAVTADQVLAPPDTLSQGRTDVYVRGPASGSAPPVTSEVTVSIRQGGQINSAPVRVLWKASDDLTRAAALVHQIQTRRQTNAGWSAWSSTATITGKQSAAFVTSSAGVRGQYRVRTRDEAGNWGRWVESNTIKLMLRQHGRFDFTGTWTRVADDKATNGDVRRSSTAGSTATLTFVGDGVAAVLPAGPGRGRVQVCLDFGTADARCRSVDLASYSPAGPRRLIVAFTGLVRAQHSLRLRVVSGTVDLDAALVGTP